MRLATCRVVSGRVLWAAPLETLRVSSLPAYRLRRASLRAALAIRWRGRAPILEVLDVPPAHPAAWWREPV